MRKSRNAKKEKKKSAVDVVNNRRPDEAACRLMMTSPHGDEQEEEKGRRRRRRQDEGKGSSHRNDNVVIVVDEGTAIRRTTARTSKRDPLASAVDTNTRKATPTMVVKMMNRLVSDVVMDDVNGGGVIVVTGTRRWNPLWRFACRRDALKNDDKDDGGTDAVIDHRAVCPILALPCRLLLLLLLSCNHFPTVVPVS